VAIGSGAFVVNQSLYTLYTGNITGTGSITKSGSGTLAFFSSNITHTGPISVTAGTLTIGNSIASSSNGVGVLLGATLSGGGNIARPVTIAGTVAPGNSVGQLSVGNTVLLPGGTYAFEYNIDAANPTTPGTTHDHLRGLTAASLDLSNLSTVNRFNITVTSLPTGTPTVGHVSYTFITFDTITGLPAGDVSDYFNISGNFASTPTVFFTDGISQDTLTISYAPVPEPGALLLLGAVALAMARRLRRSQTSTT
jgi:autotransporter-associated beta strand protein